MRITRVASFVAVWAALCVAAPAPGSAQAEPSADDVEMARDLFRSGMDAADQGRWNEARLDFERSYQLVPRASTLLNLAAAQAEVGALVEAVASYRAFIAEAQTGRAARYRAEAEEALRDIEPRIARVTLTVEGRLPGDVLEVNGEPQPASVFEGPMTMNPGPHHLVIRRDGEDVGDIDLNLVEGEERGITMRAEARAPTAALEPDPAEGDDLAANPWLWVGIGAGVLLIAGVVIGVVVGTSQSPELFTGNLGPGMVTFE